MHRTIAGYHQDPVDDWVAELSCGHNQHIRHDPPFHERPWVLDPAGRASRLGHPLECPLCDRFEIPDAYRIARTSAEWDEHTMPMPLRRSHRLAAGVWGRIVMGEGRMRFTSEAAPSSDYIVTADAPQAIPPELSHSVEPLGSVRFVIQFYQP